MGMGRADENGSVASSIRHADRFNNLVAVTGSLYKAEKLNAVTARVESEAHARQSITPNLEMNRPASVLSKCANAIGHRSSVHTQARFRLPIYFIQNAVQWDYRLKS